MTKENERLHIIQHPVVQHKLGYLRSKLLKSADFRTTLHEMSKIIAYEAIRSLPTKKIKVESNKGLITATTIANWPIVVSIMRSGNEMLDAVLSLLPEASAGHIGIYRDRFVNNTIEYYFRLPKHVKNKDVILLDPVLATGDTVLACIERLKQFKVRNITIVCVLVSKLSAEKIHYYYPEVEIYAAAKEAKIDDKGFITPGIGDVGNRLYGIESDILE